MAEKNVGGLLVLDGANVVGVVTERDLARKVFLMAKPAKDTPVREIMTTQVMYVSPERTSEECMALMTENRFRHLPVLEQGQARRPGLHRRPGEGRDLRAEIHHRAAGALHRGVSANARGGAPASAL